MPEAQLRTGDLSGKVGDRRGMRLDGVADPRRHPLPLSPKSPLSASLSSHVEILPTKPRRRDGPAGRR